jgi:hypothetical protein
MGEINGLQDEQAKYATGLSWERQEEAGLAVNETALALGSLNGRTQITENKHARNDYMMFCRHMY